MSEVWRQQQIPYVVFVVVACEVSQLGITTVYLHGGALK